MKNVVKLLTLGLVFGWCAFAWAATFLDKTSLDQLGYRTLEPGQVTWNEEDGSAVLYVGSPTETKNLRVIDPASLRGYRYKHITAELTYNCSSNMMDLGDGKFKWTSPDTSPRKFYYKPITSKFTVPENNGSTWTVDMGSSGSFPYHSDNRLCTYDDVTGEYTEVWPAAGTELDPASLEGTVYYQKIGYWEASIQIISKDSAIQELDYTYTETAGMFGDFTPIITERTCVYDGRTATVTIMILKVSGNGKFCQVEKWDAKCIGVGDLDGYVNDVTDEFDIQIRDTQGTYHLKNLRNELYHKYDGNRGFDWSRYKAYQTVYMRDYSMLWNSIVTNVMDSTDVHNSSYAIGLSGEYKDQLAFSGGSAIFMRYVPGDGAASPYAGAEIQITAWSQNNTTKCWEMTFDCSTPIPDRYLTIQYRQKLENYDGIWQEITALMTDTSGGNMTTYKAVVPQVYGIPNSGFFRVLCNATDIYGRLKIKATVSALGTDGRMYKLQWPQGGGTVTAVLDDNED